MFIEYRKEMNIMKLKKIAVVNCLVIAAICLMSGCQNNKSQDKENSQNMQKESSTATEEDSAGNEEMNFPELIRKAFEENPIFSSEQGFGFSQAQWGCTVEEISEVLGVTFDTNPGLAGKDSFAYLSVGYTGVLGYEAKVQAEVYHDQVNALTFQMDGIEETDIIYKSVKECIEIKSGAPLRESAAEIPEKKSVWEHGETGLVLTYNGSNIKITMGKGLDTAHIDPVEIKVENLKNTSGEYEINGVAWGSDETETAQALGLRFYDIPVSMNETLSVYPSRDKTVILGYTARVNAEYHENGLAQLSFEIETDDTEAVFEKLFEELKKQYGETFKTIENTETKRISYRWDSEKTQETALLLSKTGDNIVLDLVRL